MDETIGLMHENGFGKFGENMKSMLHDQDASARSDAGIIVMSMFFAGLLIVAFTTNPVASGTQIGERAPIFSGEAYDGNSWSSFDFEDLLDTSWTWNSTEDSPWIAVEFLDTDCGYCKQSAPDVGQWAEMYSAEQWPGPDVIFIAVAVEFVAETSRAEIIEFRSQYNNNFAYVDDLDISIAKSGTCLQHQVTSLFNQMVSLHGTATKQRIPLDGIRKKKHLRLSMDSMTGTFNSTKPLSN
ncbi:MAG: hypothetical protein VXV71_03650 [Candidatus Thermoplasmatota archaeon]|nr:hypothetical protein [Candidatus Thermoplasmatota archaeon]